MKNALVKLRMSRADKAILKRAAKLAKIPLSVLIRLCLSSERHVPELNAKASK